MVSVNPRRSSPASSYSDTNPSWKRWISELHYSVASHNVVRRDLTSNRRNPQLILIGLRMDSADRWSAGARWPCYLSNVAISVSSSLPCYSGATPAPPPSVGWLSSAASVVCRPSYLDVTSTQSSSSSSSSARFLKPAAPAAANHDKQISDTGRLDDTQSTG